MMYQPVILSTLWNYIQSGEISTLYGKDLSPTVWEVENGGRAPQTAGLLDTIFFLLNMSINRQIILFYEICK